MFKKITIITMLAAFALPTGAAFARPHHGGWYPPPRHHRIHDGYHRDRVTSALIIGSILGAVITAQAKDKENDGVNDRPRCDSCGKR